MSTNFLQWNPTQANQENDSAYLADPQRTGGSPTGVDFPSATANKLFYQVSTFIAALANSLSNKGYNPTDASVSSLEGVLANMVTFADLKANLTSVGFSTTPAFNAASTNGFDFVLAGNVSSSTLTGAQVGQTIIFVITQGSTPYTFSPPSNINGWIPVNATPNSVTTQAFIVKEDGTIWPTATEINVLLAQITALSTSLVKTVTDRTGSRSFGTTYTTSVNLFINVTGELSLGVGNTATIQGIVGSIAVDTASIMNSSGFTCVSFFVPAGSSYRVNTGGIGAGDNQNAVLYKWVETSGV